MSEINDSSPNRDSVDAPSTPAPVRGAWKRRKWVIDPRLQVMLIGASALFGLAILGLFYGMTAKASEEFISFVANANIPNRERLIVRFNEVCQLFRIGILVGFIGFSVLFAFLMLKLSNQIAGPMFNLTRTLRVSRETGKLEKVRFRKGDLLQEVGEEYNRLVDHLREKESGDK